MEIVLFLLQSEVRWDLNKLNVCELSGDAGDGGPDEHRTWTRPLYQRDVLLPDMGRRLLPLLDGLPGEENILFLPVLPTIVLRLLLIIVLSLLLFTVLSLLLIVELSLLLVI